MSQLEMVVQNDVPKDAFQNRFSQKLKIVYNFFCPADDKVIAQAPSASSHSACAMRVGATIDGGFDTTTHQTLEA